MSQDNVAAVHRMFEAVNAGDFEAAGRDVSDDVVLVLHGGAVTVAGDGAVGRAAFDRWFADWFRQFERGYRFELGEARADGDRVRFDATHHARGRLSGAEVTMKSTWVFEFRDGRIVRCDGYSA